MYSFSYPNFYQLRNDPLHVLGFGVGHIAILIVLGGFVVPRWFDVFIPPSRRGEGLITYGANVEADVEEMERNAAMEQAHKIKKDDDLAAAGPLGEGFSPSPSTEDKAVSADNSDDGREKALH